MYFHFFSQLLQPWILPPGLNLLLTAIGLVWLRHSKRIGKCIIAIAFATLWMFSTSTVAKLLIDPLQNQYPALQLNQIQQNNHSAIIILGGGHEISSKSENGYILSDATEERLHYAAYLYHHTHFPVITSGGKLNPSSPSEAELMQLDLKNYFNVPVTWTENESVDTKDEGRLLAPILQKNNITTAYLVTNAWHMPRAMDTFQVSLKGMRIKIISAPTGYAIFQSGQRASNFLPSFEALDKSATALHEYIGILAYKIRNLYEP